MPVAGQYEIDLARNCVTAARDIIRPAVEAFGVAYQRVKAAADIVTSLKSLGDAVLAAEAIEAAAAESAKKLRTLMAATMELGATTITTDSGKWTLVDLPPLVEIADPKAVPDEFLTVAEPKPDKARISAHIRAGAAINWATLRKDRGVTARFTARKG